MNEILKKIFKVYRDVKNSGNKLFLMIFDEFRLFMVPVSFVDSYQRSSSFLGLEKVNKSAPLLNPPMIPGCITASAHNSPFKDDGSKANIKFHNHRGFNLNDVTVNYPLCSCISNLR